MYKDKDNFISIKNGIQILYMADSMLGLCHRNLWTIKPNLPMPSSVENGNEERKMGTGKKDRAKIFDQEREKDRDKLMKI